MSLPTLPEFTEKTNALGYDGVSIRTWEPNSVSQTHTHEFAVHAVVAQGEMWLTRGDDTQHLQVGDTFKIRNCVCYWYIHQDLPSLFRD